MKVFKPPSGASTCSLTSGKRPKRSSSTAVRVAPSAGTCFAPPTAPRRTGGINTVAIGFYLLQETLRSDDLSVSDVSPRSLRAHKYLRRWAGFLDARFYRKPGTADCDRVSVPGTRH